MCSKGRLYYLDHCVCVFSHTTDLEFKTSLLHVVRTNNIKIYIIELSLFYILCNMYIIVLKCIINCFGISL